MKKINTERVLIGLPTAPGIAIGEVFLYRHDQPQFSEYMVPEADRPREIERFKIALANTRKQISSLREHLSIGAGETAARIFDAQQLILEDVEFLGTIESEIMNTGLNAETITFRTAQEYKDKLMALEGQIFHQRAQDIMDIGLRIIKNLLGLGDGPTLSIERPYILVADDLLPSDVVHLIRENVQAVATDLGAAASHTAILTKSLEVPAVVGLRELTQLVATGDRIILNGNSGKVIINPTLETEKYYREKLEQYIEYIESLKDYLQLPAQTTDNHRVALRANIELPQEIRAVVERGGDGVGLFRSEYLLLARRRVPSEEEQYEDYKKVIAAAYPNVVTIRTFDIGGDKMFPELPLPKEANPFMGWRAIRVGLDHPELLRTQLRAILRAAVFGKARIMIPFVSGLHEIRQVKVHLKAVKAELSANKIPFNPDVELGVMIELPSAVIMSDKLAMEVDFFSIGTNDLTQFTLAVDRGNERVSDRFQPLHPAVLRMVKHTIEAGHKNGIEVAMCGELAANPTATMLLVGLGLDELSVSPVALPEIKKLIRSFSYEEAIAMADIALNFDTVYELKEYCYETMKHRFANLPIWFSEV